MPGGICPQWGRLLPTARQRVPRPCGEFEHYTACAHSLPDKHTNRQTSSDEQTMIWRGELLRIFLFPYTDTNLHQTKIGTLVSTLKLINTHH